MESNKQSLFTGKLMMTIVLTAVVAAVACTAVLKLLDVESSSAIIGGVVGAVVASIIPSLATRKPAE